MADEEKAPSPSLPPKLNLSKLSARAAAKPGDAEPPPPAPVPADKPTTPSVPRPAATPPGSLPKPGPAAGPSSPSPSASAPTTPESIRLKPKLQPPPRPAASTPPDRPVSPAAPAAPVSPVAPAAKADDESADHDAPVAPVPTGSKRETSRIPLDTAQSVGPKTIRIKPVAKPTAPPPTAGDETSMQDAKRRTSRISLESALGGATDEAAGGPKTIRLKRPAEPGAEKVTPPPAPDSKDAFTKTAPIAEAASDVPLTQKKTIRVKRPGQSPVGPRSAPVVRRAGGGEGGAEVAAMVPAAKAEDRAHWTFVTFSIFSVMILIVTVYLFAAQAFGPNLSLTRLSYGAEGMELPWPGRLYP